MCWFLTDLFRLVGLCYTVRKVSLFLNGVTIQRSPTPRPDTVYACQDIKDDLKAGVRSTAILFGSWIRPLLVGCGLTFVGSLILVGSFNNQAWPYFVISVGGSLIHLVWQFMTVDLDDPSSCWGTWLDVLRLSLGRFWQRRCCCHAFSELQGKWSTWLDCLGRYHAGLLPCHVRGLACWVLVN